MVETLITALLLSLSIVGIVIYFLVWLYSRQEIKGVSLEIESCFLFESKHYQSDPFNLEHEEVIHFAHYLNVILYAFLFVTLILYLIRGALTGHYIPQSSYEVALWISLSINLGLYFLNRSELKRKIKQTYFRLAGDPGD